MSNLDESTDLEERVAIARACDKILKKELTEAGIPHDLAEVRVYDIKTVGVQGDGRTYCYPIEIELSEQFTWNPEFIRRLSEMITRERLTNRVVYVIA